MGVSRSIPVLFAFMVLLGCGSKKKTTERQTSKVTVRELRDISLEQARIENARVLTDSVGSRVVYEPIDPEKPSRVAGTTFENARIVREDTRLERREELRDSSGTILSDNTRTDTNSLNRSRSSDSDVKRQSPWPWLALGVAVVFFLLYFFARNRRFL